MTVPPFSSSTTVWKRKRCRRHPGTARVPTDRPLVQRGSDSASRTDQARGAWLFVEQGDVHRDRDSRFGVFSGRNVMLEIRRENQSVTLVHIDHRLVFPKF